MKKIIFENIDKRDFENLDKDIKIEFKKQKSKLINNLYNIYNSRD